MSRIRHPRISEIPRRLGRLSPVERRVWQAFPHGDLVDLRTGDEELDRPAQADQWGEDRVVRGEVIAALLLGARPTVAGAVSALRLAGARITGRLSGAHGRFTSQVLLQGCRFEGPVTLDEATTGPIDLSGSHLTTLSAYGAQVHGTLDLRDAVVEGGERFAVHADGITVEGSLLANRITVTGSFSLINAVVSGQVTVNDARLLNTAPGGKSLNAGGIRVGRSLLAQRLEAVGEVRLPGAHIGSALLFDGATLTGPEGGAFNGTSMTVASEASFRPDRTTAEERNFTAHGSMSLLGAWIGASLMMSGATLHRPAPADGARATWEQAVLNASRMTVAGTLNLSNGFTTDGEIRLTSARVGHLDVRGMTSPEALLTLYGATVESGIRDDLVSWPDRLNLDGFSYGSFARYLEARDRLRLLRRQVRTDRTSTGSYRAQPYEQLASYYRALGNDGEARTVLLAKMRSLSAHLPWWRRIPGRLLDALVGYGYRPMRAFGWAVGLLVVASCYFSTVRPQHVSSEDESAFNPVLYAADRLIPIIHFGQVDVWQYHGVPAVVTVVLTVLGWTLGLAIAAAATRTFTRS
ncbi:pentapeptide repeat-containing protein [Kitasatospora sp. NPDC008050]|uniref:pentapeptide repeat-containing protein n=1 Tax=Kitasatospora sp. NPDC008050 TaxID=3364021 RepID=UPI0036DFF1B1